MTHFVFRDWCRGKYRILEHEYLDRFSLYTVEKNVCDNEYFYNWQPFTEQKFKTLGEALNFLTTELDKGPIGQREVWP